MLSIAATDPIAVDVLVDHRPLRLSWTWLRDHARDPESFLASAQQRIVPVDIVSTTGAADATVDGDQLVVVWPEGPTVTYGADFLRDLSDASGATQIGDRPEPWTADTADVAVVRVSHTEISRSDDALRRALTGLWRSGLVVFEGVPTDMATTRSTLERFGYIRTTIFGDMWEFASDGGFDDTASTPLEITPHTDGTYSHDAPGLLGLHCHVYAARGGENVFVDGHSVAARLSDDARSILSSVDIPAQYIGDGAHLMAQRPVLRYVGDRLIQVSYNHHDRAAFLLPEPTMSQLYAALHEFDALANSPELQFELGMRPGDMVLFDNWRLLHGRRAFTGERRIAGGYINREDVESTTRRLDARSAVGAPATT